MLSPDLILEIFAGIFLDALMSDLDKFIPLAENRGPGRAGLGTGRLLAVLYPVITHDAFTDVRDFLIPIIAPFSPPQQHKAETRRQFQQALSLSISDLLPWKVLLISELIETRKFTDLTIHYTENQKKDLVSKFIHLLELEKEGQLKIHQEEPFGDIIIEPLQAIDASTITIKDRLGKTYDFDWRQLSDAQKRKVISDIKAYRVICKLAEAR